MKEYDDTGQFIGNVLSQVRTYMFESSNVNIARARKSNINMSGERKISI